jgi:hypothetical protein
MEHKVVLALVVIALVCILVLLVALDFRDRAVPTEVSVKLHGDADRSWTVGSAVIADLMARRGWRRTALTADAAIFSRRYRSVWVWAVTICLFPLGLLAYWNFVRVSEAHLSVITDPSSQTWTLRGVIPISLAKRVQAALESEPTHRLASPR